MGERPLNDSTPNVLLPSTTKPSADLVHRFNKNRRSPRTSGGALSFTPLLEEVTGSQGDAQAGNIDGGAIRNA